MIRKGGVHAKDRGVAAGRDVLAQLVATGDHNTFFTGGYQPLREAYIDPGEVFDRVGVDDFVGREWLIDDLDRFLEEHDRGYFVIQAEAGLGKTALLAHLVKTRGWIHHFAEQAPGEAGINNTRLNLAAQVMRAFELDSGHDGPAAVPETAAARPDYLGSLLRSACDQLGDGEKIVVAIDALDEAGTRPGEQVLGLPRTLPPGAFVVATKRPVPVLLSTEGPREDVQINAASEANVNDLRRFLTRAVEMPAVMTALDNSGLSAEQFTQALLDRSAGVWIYVHYFIGHIEWDQPAQIDLDALPLGIWGWYYDFWQRWRDEHAAEWYARHLPVLATLAAAHEELSLATLCTLAGVEPPLEEIPPRWRPTSSSARNRLRATGPTTPASTTSSAGAASRRTSRSGTSRSSSVGPRSRHTTG